MSGSNQTLAVPSTAVNVAAVVAVTEEQNWYAVQTKARHEKIVAARLQEQGITSFVPLITEVHRWSDRKKSVELPLFSCYVFVKVAPTNEARVQVCRTSGVFQIVGTRGEGTPIPDQQIEAVQTLIGQELPW